MLTKTEHANGDTPDYQHQGDWAGWALAGRVDALLDGAGLTDPPGDYEDGGGPSAGSAGSPTGSGNNGAPVDVRATALQRSAAVAAQLRSALRVMAALNADLQAQVAVLTAELAVLHAREDGEG